MEFSSASPAALTRRTPYPRDIDQAKEYEAEGNFEQAFKAWQTLANNNHEPIALYRCGLMLLAGIGTLRDQNLGLGYLADAANYGHSEACELFQNRFNNPPVEMPYQLLGSIFEFILKVRQTIAKKAWSSRKTISRLEYATYSYNASKKMNQ